MDDYIDDIRDGWARVRPDLPTRSVGVVSLIGRLSRQFRLQRAAVLAGLGIDQATLELLANLRRRSDVAPMTPSALAQWCGVTPAAVSLRLRRAEQSGWVTRQATAEDRRAVHVQLTASGREAADRFAQLVLQRDEELVARMSDQDLRYLEHLLRALNESARMKSDTADGRNERRTSG